MQFIAYYVRNDKVVAVARYVHLCICRHRLVTSLAHSMQKDPVVSKASELLRLGLMPSPAELRAGKVS